MSLSYARLKEFDGPINEASRSNEIINEIICQYACCDIITKEEALSRMVIALAGYCGRVDRRLFECYRDSGSPGIYFQNPP